MTYQTGGIVEPQRPLSTQPVPTFTPETAIPQGQPQYIVNSAGQRIPQTPYTALQGERAGIPGGFKAIPYEHPETKNRIFVNTVGGMPIGKNRVPEGFVPVGQETSGINLPSKYPTQIYTSPYFGSPSVTSGQDSVGDMSGSSEAASYDPAAFNTRDAAINMIGNRTFATANEAINAANSAVSDIRGEEPGADFDMTSADMTDDPGGEYGLGPASDDPDAMGMTDYDASQFNGTTDSIGTEGSGFTGSTSIGTEGSGFTGSTSIGTEGGSGVEVSSAERDEAIAADLAAIPSNIISSVIQTVNKTFTNIFGQDPEKSRSRNVAMAMKLATISNPFALLLSTVAGYMADRAQDSLAMAAAQNTALGPNNNLGIGNYTMGNIFSTGTLLGYPVVVTDHPTWTPDQVRNYDLVRMSIDPNDKTFSNKNITWNAAGSITSYDGPKTLSSFYAGVRGSGIGTVGAGGAYNLVTGTFVGLDGEESVMGTVDAFSSLTATEQAQIVSLRKGTWNEIPESVQEEGREAVAERSRMGFQMQEDPASYTDPDATYGDLTGKEQSWSHPWQKEEPETETKTSTDALDPDPSTALGDFALGWGGGQAGGAAGGSSAEGAFDATSGGDESGIGGWSAGGVVPQKPKYKIPDNRGLLSQPKLIKKAPIHGRGLATR